MNFNLKQPDEHGYTPATFSIRRAGEWRWLPTLVTFSDAMSELKYKSEQIYRARHYQIPTRLDVFFFGLIFSLRLHKRHLSESMYRRVE